MTPISRARKLGLAALLAPLCLLTGAAPAWSQATPAPVSPFAHIPAPSGVSPFSSIDRPRVLMRSGAGSQAAEFPRRAMAKVLAELNMPVTFIEDVAFFTPENLADFDIVINSGSVDQITPAEETAVYNFVQNGGSFLGLHNASAGGAVGGDWEKLIGGRFIKHPPPYMMRVRVTEAVRKHPITRGVETFEVVDEHHFVSYHVEPAPPGSGPPGRFETSFWTSAPSVLFQSESIDNTVDPELPEYRDFTKNGVTAVIGGWSREIGKGRMVFMAPGHMNEVMQHPMMQKLYANSMKWLAREN